MKKLISIILTLLTLTQFVTYAKEPGCYMPEIDLEEIPAAKIARSTDWYRQNFENKQIIIVRFDQMEDLPAKLLDAVISSFSSFTWSIRLSKIFLLEKIHGSFYSYTANKDCGFLLTFPPRRSHYQFSKIACH